MNKYLTIINHRTLISFVIVLISLIYVNKYGFIYNIDLTLLSIAIIFPLVFNIRGSFKRREKALEHLSEFRGALMTLHYYFMSCSKLSENDKDKISGILIEISNKLINHLNNSGSNMDELDKSTQKVFTFVMDNKVMISRRIIDKIFRFMNDLHVSIENLNGIHVHRTPISLKAYCKFFIYIFPIIYTPTIVFQVGIESSMLVTGFIVLFTQFILISLYNIQDDLEYPFDKIGLDDINLEIFQLDRKSTSN